MARLITAALLSLGLVATAAAQDTTVGALLADGFEIKGVTAANLDPSNTTNGENVFIILQKDTEAFGCVLRSIDTSFCQRMQ